MGNSAAFDNISTVLILTSILPVFKSKFSVPLDLLTTTPEILTTDSGRVFPIKEKIYYCSLLHIV